MARLLVIDDDPVLVDLMAEWLEIAGHSVDIAQTGTEALGRLAESTYDLVISDWQLPDVTGHDVLLEIRAGDNQVPLLFTTGLKDKAILKQALDSGATDVLVKPFKFDQLGERIKFILEGEGEH